MYIEFIGTITTYDSPYVDPTGGSLLDLDYLRRITLAHSTAGFDKVLVPFVSTVPDTLLVAHYAAACSESLGFLLAHRAGITVPTAAARALATLDQMTNGRIALHLVTGGSDVTQRRDGDYLDKAARYRRTAEYAAVLKKLWAAEGPIDHVGEFYRFEGAWSLLRPVNGSLSVYFGGASDDAQRVAAHHADVAILWGEPLAGVAEQIAAVRALAAQYGREEAIRFALAVRPIIGRTDADAWTRAREIFAILAASASDPGAPSPRRQHSAGFSRVLTAAVAGDVHDRALWTAPARLPGAHGNATALVGSPDTVVSALLDYVAVGISGFVINGYNPVEDALAYGLHLIPAVRSVCSG